MGEMGEGREVMSCLVGKTKEQILGGCPAGRPEVGGDPARPEPRPVGAGRKDA